MSNLAWCLEPQYRETEDRPATPLTSRQTEVLNFLSRFSMQNGRQATYAEIGRALGISSTGTIHKHLKALRRKREAAMRARRAQ